ncbi:PAS domain S-box protein [Komarekiella sp. 'clone 1']|uniref:Circadian input-output histidine kinase CikA n=1 Tax=Komarekiella delphini-convector SJRDD-AB1 TaxID=2593771 RepID=A0AA40VNW0_9NOST|nr:PAS domain S-box protein [Komarekiella delphini-convector]MBD6614669.1 PAS domain S-box protein [Komarekiella delphini-convector SJRDD-AB1]
MSRFRFLLLEDNPLDVEAIQAMLTGSGIDYELLRVNTRADFVTVLETDKFDLILANYALPDFDGIAALEIALNLCPETPFIFVSASLGEELAIEALKLGATDYVLKQRLGRLVPCVQQALHSAQERRDRKRAKAALREEEKYRTLFESLDEGFCICEMLFDKNGKPIDYRFLEVNSVFEKLTGLEQATGKTARELVPNLEADWFEIYGRVVRTGEPVRFENQSIVLNRWFDVNAFCIGAAQSNQFAILFTNISDRKRVEQERERFLAVGSDLQVITGINGYFQWVSPTFERTLGWTVDEMISRPWTDFVHPDDISKSVSEADSLFSNNETFAFENRYRHKDGSYRWFLWNAQSYPQEQVIYGAAVDITERVRVEDDRKRAEQALHQSEEQSRYILESINDGFFALDHDWRFVYVNQAAERLLNYTPGELLGKDFWETFPGLAGSEFEQLHRRVMNERVASSITSFYPDHNRWYDVHSYPAANGITIYFRDITEREKLLQQEQAAREAAEQANRIKDEFLAVLSHELRSPLNPILGWARLLQSGKFDAARQAEALATIERNARLQSQLIEDLLDISRIMQGKLTLIAAHVNLAFVISAAVDTVRLAAQAKNIQLQLDLDTAIAPISGDAARLQQVAWNLLTNAVKFTPNGGQVIVELKQIDRLAQIRVMDTGKGINPQFLPHVFEYFRQEDGSTTRKFGGLGLGLAIVRQIVEMHGGTVRAESRGENQGATFIVQLPAMQQATPIISEPTCTQTDTEAPLDNIQILLVDDDTDTREFQAFLLEQSGAKVTAVSSGLEALQALDQLVPDVLVSDVGMAKMDGYMLMQQIRSRPASQGGTVRAIALTAYAAELDQQKAIQAGFQMHITKPVEPEILVSKIVSLLKYNRPHII